jgi:hypothetical protein
LAKFIGYDDGLPNLPLGSSLLLVALLGICYMHFAPEEAIRENEVDSSQHYTNDPPD